MLLKRTISGFVVAALTLVFVLLGGNYLFLGLLVLSLIGIKELYSVMDMNKTWIIAGYILILIVYALAYFAGAEYIPPIIFTVIFFIIILIKYPNVNVDSKVLAVVGIFYVGAFALTLYRIRMMDDGRYYLGLVFIASWFSDVFAYFSGMLFGHKHIFPKLSPKKTVAGCIGAIIGSSLSGLIFAIVCRRDVLTAFLICLVGSVFAQIGDLSASVIKRIYGKKDYGNLIPGHGGVMDRFDSTFFVSAVLFIVFKFAL